MRKLLSIILVVVLLIPLAGCNQISGLIDSNKPNEQTEKPAEVAEPAETENNSQANTDNTKIGVFDKTAELSETVLVDEKDVKITATGISFSNYSFEVDLFIENNSNEDLTFLCGTMGYSCNSVNGFMVSDGYLNCDVKAGKKANDSIKFDYYGLQLCGINAVAEIELGFDIEDDDYNHFYTGPRKLTTSIADSYVFDEEGFQKTIVSQAFANKYGYTVRQFVTDDLYNSNGIIVDSSGIIENKDGEQMLFVEVVNTLSDSVQLVVHDICANGLCVSGTNWIGGMISPGKRVVVEATIDDYLSDSFKEMFGIDEIGEVQAQIDTWDEDNNYQVSDTKMITVTVPGAKTDFDRSGTEVYSKNGIRIISKGITEGKYSYDDDYYAVFVVENTGKKPAVIDDEYDSLSVNDIMCDYFLISITAEVGVYTIMEIELEADSLEKAKVNDINDIQSIEIELNIRDQNWNKIDNPTITVNY